MRHVPRAYLESRLDGLGDLSGPEAGVSISPKLANLFDKMLTQIATEREEKSARRNRWGRGKGQETRLLTVPKPIEGIFLPLLRVKWEAGAILCLFAVDLDRRASEASMLKLSWEKRAKKGMVNERTNDGIL